jgi:holo-[acyl-carrier protein] synthase
MHSVGMDLVEIADVREAIEAFGDVYLQRVFTPREQHECCDHPAGLAERFAAKEAAVKALELDDRAYGWQTIEVLEGNDRQPVLTLRGAVGELAQQRGIRNIALSVTRNRDHAAAIVLMEVQR